MLTMRTTDEKLSSNQEEELKLKKERQNKAKEEIAEFMRNRQEEVKNLQEENSSKNIILPQEQHIKSKASLIDNTLGNCRQKYRSQGWRLPRIEEC